MFDGFDVGTLIQWAALTLIVVGAVWRGRRGEAKKIAAEVNEENMKLADVRGKRVDDLEDEVKGLIADVARMSVEIQVLKDERVDRIIEGVVVGLRPFLPPNLEQS